jgi:hypothetical protein
MNTKHPIYKNDLRLDAEDSLYSIINLCKVGVAAGDTTMAVEMKDGGLCALFEAIASVAQDGIDRMEK